MTNMQKPRVLFELVYSADHKEDVQFLVNELLFRLNCFREKHTDTELKVFHYHNQEVQPGRPF